jgi:hypothetical protein
MCQKIRQCKWGWLNKTHLPRTYSPSYRKASRDSSEAYVLFVGFAISANLVAMVLTEKIQKQNKLK